MTDDSLYEISTRDYRPTDAQALAEVYRAAIMETAQACYSAAQCSAWAAGADDAAAWALRLQENWVRVAVDEEGGVAGFGGILMPGSIDLLFVAPEAGRQGVGSLILEDLLELAAAMGAKKVSCTASDLAKPFFEKHGFTLLESSERDCAGQRLSCHALVRG